MKLTLKDLNAVWKRQEEIIAYKLEGFTKDGRARLTLCVYEPFNDALVLYSAYATFKNTKLVSLKS